MAYYKLVEGGFIRSIYEQEAQTAPPLDEQPDWDPDDLMLDLGLVQDGLCEIWEEEYNRIMAAIRAMPKSSKHIRYLLRNSTLEVVEDKDESALALDQYEAIKAASSVTYPIPYYCHDDPEQNLRPVVGLWYSAQNVKAECWASPVTETPPRGMTDTRYFRNWQTF